MSLWLSALLAAAVGVEAAPREAGVLVVGRDVPQAEVARVQSRVEHELETAGWTVAGADELAPRLGAREDDATAEADARVRAEIEKLVASARRAYFSGSNEAALRALAEATEQQAAAAGLPASDRVTVALWRATVRLAAGDPPGAQGDAVEAVRLDPDLEVPLSTFPPPVKALVDTVRAGVLATAVPVTFTGATRGASVLVDDRPVSGGRLALAPGRHWLRVRAPGFHEHVAAIEVTAGAPVVIELPALTVAVPAARIARLGTRRGLADAAGDARVSTLVVVLLAPDGIRTRLWREGDDAGASFARPDVDGALRWLRAELPTGSAPAVATTPPATPVETPTRDGTAPRTASAGGTRAYAGARAAFVERRLSARGIDDVTLELGGTGAAAGVRHARGLVRAHAGVWVVSFAPSQTAAVVGDVRARAPGGTLAGARASAGAALLRGRLSVSAGASFERYQAPELTIDEDVPLFTSETRIAPELRLGTELPLGPFRFDGEVGVAPMAIVSEEPVGTTGKGPRGGPDVDWRIAMRVPFGRAWHAGLAYTGGLRRVAFEGSTSTRFDPDVADATVTETAHFVTLTVGRGF